MAGADPVTQHPLNTQRRLRPLISSLLDLRRGTSHTPSLDSSSSVPWLPCLSSDLVCGSPAGRRRLAPPGVPAVTMIGMAKKPISSSPAPWSPPAFLRMSVFPLSSVRFGFVSGGHSHLASENPAIRFRGPVGGRCRSWICVRQCRFDNLIGAPDSETHERYGHGSPLMARSALTTSAEERRSRAANGRRQRTLDGCGAN